MQVNGVWVTLKWYEVLRGRGKAKQSHSCKNETGRWNISKNNIRGVEMVSDGLYMTNSLEKSEPKAIVIVQSTNTINNQNIRILITVKTGKGWRSSMTKLFDFRYTSDVRWWNIVDTDAADIEVIRVGRLWFDRRYIYKLGNTLGLRVSTVGNLEDLWYHSQYRVSIDFGPRSAIKFSWRWFILADSGMIGNLARVTILILAAT